MAPARAPGAAPSGGRLDRYREKRDFEQTPEPRGEPRRRAGASLWNRLPKGHRFCVQMHRARALHWDLRLEHDDALLSWAVPKGPSGKPGVRRLAVQVEDHPVDYGDFEDVIPSGYGAGTVLLWDEGSFEWAGAAREDLAQALGKGHLDFELKGERLRGSFSLILRSSAGEKGKKQWLLLKRGPGKGGPDSAGAEDRSVKTGRTLGQIEAGRPARKPPRRPQPARQEAAPRGRPPADLRPMLARLVDAPFSREGWLFELKYDGERILLHLGGAKVALRGRSGRDESERYPELRAAAKAIRAKDAVVDGEVVSLAQDGHPSFGRLQQRMQLDSRQAQAASEQEPVVLMAFDLLFLDGRDLRQLPLRQRKETLRSILPSSPRIRYADDLEDDGEALFQEVKAAGLEGVMAKQADSRYEAGRRSTTWLKIKARMTQDCVILGFTEGRGKRRHIGALVLGVYEQGSLRVAGKVGTGFSETLLKDLRLELEPLRTSSHPKAPAALTSAATWVQPKVVCEVEHAGWTSAGNLRQPSFKTLRRDVPPRACVREAEVAKSSLRLPDPSPVESRSAASGARDRGPEQAAIDHLMALPPKGGSLRVGRRTIKVTNLDKPLWPEDRLTKRDLIAYHLEMAPFLLPHLRGRAVVMQVFPDGLGSEGFWRRGRPSSAPTWIPEWTSTAHTDTKCPLLPEAAALAWAANSAALDLHPWHSRTDRPDQPDWAVIDLDPGPKAKFSHVREVAHLVKAALDELQLEAGIKTTGHHGLHIYVPIRRGPTEDQVREWVHQFASRLERSAPGLITEEWEVAKRGARVRIDYTQNVVGKTLAAAYSPRPIPGAPVSTPIAWEELDDVDLPSLNLQTVPERTRAMGDLFKRVLAGGQRLPDLSGSTAPARPLRSGAKPKRRGRD